MNTNTEEFIVRPASIEDAKAIYDLIVELALYEKAPEQVINTVEEIMRDGFGKDPVFVCFLAEKQGKVIGMSLCYTRYSTWKGRVLYLEDLIVSEPFRGIGAGKALFKHTLDYARQNKYKRVSWQVLDWNTPALDFYRSFGAGFDGEWINTWIDL